MWHVPISEDAEEELTCLPSVIPQLLQLGLQDECQASDILALHDPPAQV